MAERGDLSEMCRKFEFYGDFSIAQLRVASLYHLINWICLLEFILVLRSYSWLKRRVIDKNLCIRLSEVQAGSVEGMIAVHFQISRTFRSNIVGAVF